MVNFMLYIFYFDFKKGKGVCVREKIKQSWQNIENY